MGTRKDDRPRRNGIPLVSKRRWEAGHRGGLKQISDKRRKAMRNKAMDVPKDQRECELLPLLAGVSGWIKYRDSWHPKSPDWRTIDRHHVFGQRWHDEPWNLVLACRPAHEFCENAWQMAGKVVCMVALHRAGRFDPAAIKAASIKPDPLWQVENWLEQERLFDREPALKLFAWELLDFYGRAA